MTKKTDSRGARHSAATAEHYTPTDYTAAARRLMGGIDLDPASSARANLSVCATKFYTKKDNGLALPWRGRVFLNPPGGESKKVRDSKTGETKTKRVAPSLVRPFWERLAAAWWRGEIEQAIWIGYSLEQLQTLQGTKIGTKSLSPLDFPLCFPARRIAFLGKDLRPQESPTHGNYIAFLPPVDKTFTASIAKFRSEFIRFGAVRDEILIDLPERQDPRQLRLIEEAVR